MVSKVPSKPFCESLTLSGSHWRCLQPGLALWLCSHSAEGTGVIFSHPNQTSAAGWSESCPDVTAVKSARGQPQATETPRHEHWPEASRALQALHSLEASEAKCLSDVSISEPNCSAAVSPCSSRDHCSPASHHQQLPASGGCYRDVFLVPFRHLTAEPVPRVSCCQGLTMPSSGLQD